MMNNRNNKDNKQNTIKRFNKITIGLASPESILAESRGEVSTIVRINLSVMVFSVKEFLVQLKTTNVLVVNIKEFATKESYVTVVVLK